MTISHHPSEEILTAFVGGHLDKGHALVVATHLAACAACRQTIAMCGDVAGALLERMPATPMAADALALALARLDGPPPAPAAPVRRPEPVREDGIVYPAPLAPYRLGPWRPIGFGIEMRPVRIPRESGGRLFLLKAGPGRRFPLHTHTGTELTCVLEGAFRHELGRYGPGDVDEADDTVEHRPVVEPGGICISLVSLQGGFRFTGLVGRLLQPFVRL